MGDRHPITGEGRLALALLVMAGGLGLLAATVISLLPLLIAAGVSAFAARRVERYLRLTDALARANAALERSLVALRRNLHPNHTDRWHRPPMEGRPI